MKNIKLTLLLLATVGCSSAQKSQSSKATYINKMPASTTGAMGYAEVENSVEKFLETTKIKTGIYEASKKESGCQQGDLEIVQLENEFTLMLGARPLVIGLGREAFTTEDRACSSKIESTYTNKSIDSVKVETCNGVEVVYSVSVYPVKKGINYKRKIVKNGKTIKREICKLDFTSGP